MKVTGLPLLLVASLGLGACSTLDALKFWDRVPAEKMAELRPFTPAARLDLAWQARVGAGEDSLLLPAVDGESVFAAGIDGDVTRLRAGKAVWQVKLGTPLQAGVGVGNGLAVVGTLSGEVVALEAETGKIQWRVKVGKALTAAPLIEEDSVLLRLGDAEVLAVSVKDGHRLWDYQRATPPLSLRTFGGMRRYGNFIFVGFPGGKLAAVTLSSGLLGWEGAVSQPRGATELERLSDVVGEAVPLDRLLCAGSFQGRVTCFDVVKGTPVWGRDVSTPVGVDTDDKTLFVTDEFGAVMALEGNTGATRWKQEQLRLRKVGRPLALDRFVAVADVEGWVHLLNKQDGRFVARFKTDGSPIAAPLVRTDDGLVAQTREGGVFALKVK